MTVVELIVTYAICWWMVLFMTLSDQANPEVTPGLGHAPSAPANPRLRAKIRRTSLLALIPSVILYFALNQAYAADTIYHAGRGCEPLPAHHADADISTKDGAGAGGAKVKSATLDGGSNILSSKDKEGYDIPLNIPSAPYLNQNGTSRNADLSESFVGVGTLHVAKDGETTLNGNAVGGQAQYPDGCEHPAKEGAAKTENHETH